MSMTIVSTTVRVHGTHCWPEAPDEVAYLRMPHRHEFVIRPRVRVVYDNRGVEFHTLQASTEHAVRRLWVTPRWEDAPQWGYDFGTSSCEMIARELGLELMRAGFDVHSVRVSEDDESEAEVLFEVAP